MDPRIFVTAAGSACLLKRFQNDKSKVTSSSDADSVEQEGSHNESQRLSSFVAESTLKMKNEASFVQSSEFTRGGEASSSSSTSFFSFFNEEVKKMPENLPSRANVEYMLKNSVDLENIESRNANDPSTEYCYTETESQFSFSNTRIDVASFPSDKRAKNKRLRVSSRPMSSLESCLFAQLIAKEGSGFEEPVPSSFLTSPASHRRPLVVTDESRKGIAGTFFHQIRGPNPRLSTDFVGSSMEDTSLPRYLSHSHDYRTRISSSSRQFLPARPSIAGNSSTGVKEEVHGSARSQFSRDRLDNEATSIGSLFFSFGVGVGIMHAIFSTKKETERLNTLLRQSEDLVEDLEEEIKMRDSLVVDDITAVSRNALGVQHGPINCQRPTESSKSVNDTGMSITYGDSAKEEDMANVEAELAAELELLELNLISAGHQKEHSYINEIDPDCIADVVHGELKEDGLIASVEEEHDIDASKDEELYTGNFAVSPSELSNRLHEVLESRLQEHITELETELEATKERLQTIEAEFHCFKSLNQNNQLFTTGGIQSARYHHTGNINVSTAEHNILEASSDILNGCNDRGQCTSVHECAKSEHVEANVALSEGVEMQNDENEANYSQASLFMTLSGDALSAYTEAYSEFSKVTSGGVTTSSAEINDLRSMNQTNKSRDLQSEHVEQKTGRHQTRELNSFIFQDEELQQKNEGVFHPEPLPYHLTRFSDHEDFKKDRIHGSCSSSGLESLSSPKHKEPDSEVVSFKNSDFPDDIPKDLSGSTPCSLKFVDSSLTKKACSDWTSLRMQSSESERNTNKMITTCWNNSPSMDEACLAEKVNIKMLPVNSLQVRKDYNMPVTGGLPAVSQSVIEKIETWNSITEKGESNFEMDKSQPNEISYDRTPSTESLTYNHTSDEFDYASEVDEELGKLLIKRIIEKRKQGSPLLQKAELMLALLEENDK